MLTPKRAQGVARIVTMMQTMQTLRLGTQMNLNLMHLVVKQREGKFPKRVMKLSIGLG